MQVAGDDGEEGAHQAVAQRQGFDGADVEIVVGGDDGETALGAVVADQAGDEVFAAGVERGGGFVEQPDRAGDGDEAGEGEAAGLALREVTGVVVVEAAEADGVEGGGDGGLSSPSPLRGGAGGGGRIS